MKIYYCLILIIALASCKGSNDIGAQPSTANVAEVSMQTDANDCIINHNAEAAPQYLIGDRQAQNLIWNCAFADVIDKRRREYYTRYDYQNQCYKLRSSIEGEAICGTPAVTPNVPLIHARFINLSGGKLRAIGGSTHLVDVSFTLENDGNVTAFDLGIYLFIDDHQFAMDYPGVLLPGQSFNRETTYSIFISPGYTFGDSYTLSGEVRDNINDLLIDSFSVSIPNN